MEIKIFLPVWLTVMQCSFFWILVSIAIRSTVHFVCVGAFWDFTPRSRGCSTNARRFSRSLTRPLELQRQLLVRTFSFFHLHFPSSSITAVDRGFSGRLRGRASSRCLASSLAEWHQFGRAQHRKSVRVVTTSAQKSRNKMELSFSQSASPPSQLTSYRAGPKLVGKDRNQRSFAIFVDV